MKFILQRKKNYYIYIKSVHIHLFLGMFSCFSFFIWKRTFLPAISLPPSWSCRSSVIKRLQTEYITKQNKNTHFIMRNVYHTWTWVYRVPNLHSGLNAKEPCSIVSCVVTARRHTAFPFGNRKPLRFTYTGIPHASTNPTSPIPLLPPNVKG